MSATLPYYVPQEATSKDEPRPGWYVRENVLHVHGPFLTMKEADERSAALNLSPSSQAATHSVAVAPAAPCDRSLTCQCRCKVCKKEFTAKVADRKRGWAQCCSKSCAAIKRERRTGTYRQNMACIEAARQHHEDMDGGMSMPTFQNAHQFSNEDYFRGKD